MNVTFLGVSLTRCVSSAPLFAFRAKEFALSRSLFSKVASPLLLRAQSIKMYGTTFSSTLAGAIELDSNLLNKALGNTTIQIYQHFYALNCYFIGCKKNVSGAAFRSPAKDGIVSFEKCSFEKCISEDRAGAIFILQGSLHLSDCSFVLCCANVATQAVYAYGNPRYCLKIFRSSYFKCPATPPDTRGSVFEYSNGDQYFRDLNITTAMVGSGAGGFFSNSPTEFCSSFVFITGTQGTATIILEANGSCSEPVVLQYYCLINNTCDKEDIIICNSEMFLKDSILAGNYFVPAANQIATPTRRNLNFSIDSKTKKKKSKNTPAPTKVPYLKLENCRLDENHQRLRGNDLCRGCKSIEGQYTLYEISKPHTPGIRKATPRPLPPPFCVKMLVLGPFCCFFILLIGLVMRTTSCQAPDDLNPMTE